MFTYACNQKSVVLSQLKLPFKFRLILVLALLQKF